MDKTKKLFCLIYGNKVSIKLFNCLNMADNS